MIIKTAHVPDGAFSFLNKIIKLKKPGNHEIYLIIFIQLIYPATTAAKFFACGFQKNIIRMAAPKQCLNHKESSMKRIFNLIPGLFICLLASMSNGAIAQESTSADALIQKGLVVLQQIDGNATGDVWENAASFVKMRIPKETFVKNMNQARSAIGAVSGRRWASVVRIRYDADIQNTPAGLYANIDYATDLKDGHTVFELISFQLDPNGVWRMTGYVPRDKQ